MLQDPDPTPGAGRRWRQAAVVLGLAALIAAGAWYLSRPRPVPVALWTVERGRVEATVANTRAGTVKSCRRAGLAPAAGGEIAHLLVREGDRVKAGQVLLELWNKDLLAQERVARSQLASARPRARQACIQSDAAEREAGRSRRLRQAGFISAERLDQVVSEARARRAGCEAARAEIRQAEASVAAARAGLERTVLRVPFAGVVAKVSGEQGEFSTPSPPGIPTPPAIDLIDDGCLYVTAPIDEVDAPAIRVGMPARITLDAFPGRRFPGRVRRIAPYVLDVEKQARTVDVEIAFGDPGEARTLLVGYSADAEIVLGIRERVLRVPTQALLEGNRVLVYRPAEGTLEERRVKTGIANWEYTEVLSGLSQGERIAVSLERAGVKAGARVVPETAAPGKNAGQ